MTNTLNTLNEQLWMEESPMIGGSDTPPDMHRRFDISGEVGCLKPKDAFWTSTAIKRKHRYTSSWVEFCREELSDYLSPDGFLFKVKSKAKILTIHNDREAEVIYNKHLGPSTHLILGTWEHTWFVIKYFPWKLIAAQYDGVHYDPDYSEGTPRIMRAWDCESTVWFDMNALELVGKVKIS